MDWIVGAFGTLSGFIISYLAFQRNRDKEIRKDADSGAVIRTKLDSIGEGVNDIRVDLKVNDRQLNNLSKDFVRIDESVKSAHKRIDKVEKEVKRNG